MTKKSQMHFHRQVSEIEAIDDIDFGVFRTAIFYAIEFSNKTKEIVTLYLTEEDVLSLINGLGRNLIKTGGVSKKGTELPKLDDLNFGARTLLRSSPENKPVIVISDSDRKRLGSLTIGKLKGNGFGVCIESDDSMQVAVGVTDQEARGIARFFYAQTHGEESK